MATKTKVAVIGAGITGLASAYALAKKGHDVVVIARNTPGDYSQEWSSPW